MTQILANYDSKTILIGYEDYFNIFYRNNFLMTYNLRHNEGSSLPITYCFKFLEIASICVCSRMFYGHTLFSIQPPTNIGVLLVVVCSR
jgi:hypothetical protein